VGKEGRKCDQSGMVQRFAIRNGGTVVVVIELIVRAIEGGVELVVGCSRGRWVGRERNEQT